jgi:hypothetical protein
MAYTWLNNSDALADLCHRVPELNDYGFYRRLNDGRFEFVSFCNPLAAHFIGIRDEDLKKILDALLPKKRSNDGQAH